ncbi:MAG: hypothetical protein CMK36_00535 [Porticoccaceae bacterium]|nr:hypothetical protein [Porticoccaceae bacterium]
MLPPAMRKSWHSICIVAVESVLFVKRLRFQHLDGLKVMYVREPQAGLRQVSDSIKSGETGDATTDNK